MLSYAQQYRSHAVAACAAIGALVVVGRVAEHVLPGVAAALDCALFGKRRVRRAAEAKAAALDKQVRAMEAWLTERERSGAKKVADELAAAILKADAAGLVALQADGRASALDILAVYFARMLHAQRTTNCYTHILVDDAITTAEAADVHRAAQAPLGPLHGCPVTIKDSINVAGTDSTLGMLSYCFQPADHDAAVVTMLRRAGAVVVAKTNIPQTLISYESTNHIFGPCTNPYNAAFTCGGSSGGEGASVACCGSLIGIGTDIGGSIRIPAHFCGVVGFKPSQWRVPPRGIRTPMPGQEAVTSVCGPLTRSVDDAVVATRVMIDGAQVRDGNTIGVDFRTDVYEAAARQARVRFGYYEDDGLVAASPACRRAVQVAIAALRAAGHECTPVRPDWLGLDAAATFYGLMSSDGGGTVQRVTRGAPVIPHIANLLRIARLPGVLRRAAAWIAGRSDAYMAAILYNVREKSVTEYWGLQAERQALRHRLAAAMAREGIDVLLCPALATPAVQHGASASASMGAMFTGLLNVMDCPAITIPVTRVDRDKDAWTCPPGAHPTVEGKIRAMYDASAMAGLPVGVQLYGTRFSDEKVLGYAKILETALEGRRGA